MTKICNQPFGQERPDLPKARDKNRQYHICFRSAILGLDMRSGYFYVRKLETGAKI